MKSFVYLLAAVLVGLFFLGAVAHKANATGYGQQAVIQQYVVPQQVIVPYVQQQQAACVVEQFNAYSAPLVQRQIVQQKVVQQRVFVKEQKFRNVQRQRGGRQRSLSIQSSSSGRRGLLGIF